MAYKVVDTTGQRAFAALYATFEAADKHARWLNANDNEDG